MKAFLVLFYVLTIIQVRTDIRHTRWKFLLTADCNKNIIDKLSLGLLGIFFHDLNLVFIKNGKLFLWPSLVKGNY